jgi:hypothetical protein
MTQYVIANNVNTQLASAATPSATTLTLASSTNLPTLSAGQIMPLSLNDAATGQSYEIVYVTAITGVTLTVTRAQEGTGALTWNVGDFAFCGPTAGTVATALGNPNNLFAVAPATQSNQAVNLGQFVSSIGPNGYQKLPSGLILQWGAAAIQANPSGFTTDITLPIAFPTSALQSIVQYGGNAPPTAANSLASTLPNLNSVRITAVNASGTVFATGVTWYALGI